ncbi:MAG: alpha/beta hydrolase family protein [Thermoguttaceae bacterium]|jgi:predicted dienelactone hydrolase
MHPTRFLGWLVFLALPGPLAAGSPGGLSSQTFDRILEFTRPGPRPVVTETAVWVDRARQRPVPLKLYYPAGGEQQLPVIVYSHGLGGSREGCAYLGHFWASHGFLSVHPQHHGSDEQVWRGKIRPRAAIKASFDDPQNLVDRVDDLRFVLDSLESHAARQTPLGRRIDTSRIGIAGHAFGALAALVTAGQSPPQLPCHSAPDARVKAVLALSSPVSVGWPDHAAEYAAIRVPVLHMTGTGDDSPVGPTRAADRRVPYDNIHGADQILVTFFGADHLTFSGHLRPRASQADPYYQRRIEAASTAFWTAYLKDGSPLTQWLGEGGMAEIIGPAGWVETKSAGALARW